MNVYQPTTLDKILSFIMPIIIDRIAFIPYLLIFIFVISSLIIFRKEIVLCKRKSQKAFIYFIILSTALLVLFTTPLYILWESDNYLSNYSEEIIKIELLDLSNQGTLPKINRIWDLDIVDYSPYLNYYVQATGEDGHLIFLVTIDIPHFAWDITNDNVYVVSVSILEKNLLYERESES